MLGDFFAGRDVCWEELLWQLFVGCEVLFLVGGFVLLGFVVFVQGSIFDFCREGFLLGGNLPGRDLSGRASLLGWFVVAVFCCWEVLFLPGGFLLLFLAQVYSSPN